jgi:hypothetical protein
MTIPPSRPPITDSHPVWVHLMGLAVVACAGLVLAVAIGLAVIPWPETFGACAWFAGLCILTAITLSNRLHIVVP